MSIDLTEHSLQELEAMLVEVCNEISVREERARCDEAVVEVVPEPVVPPEPTQGAEALASPAQPASVAEEVTIRYVHPASRSLCWSGEGAAPEWVTAYLAHGGSWSAMENAAEQLVRSRPRRKF